MPVLLAATSSGVRSQAGRCLRWGEIAVGRFQCPVPSPTRQPSARECYRANSKHRDAGALYIDMRLEGGRLAQLVCNKGLKRFSL